MLRRSRKGRNGPAVAAMDAGTPRAWSVSRRTLGDGVVEALTNAILEGRFAPGDRLIEAELAGELDVSRGPIRDALRDLAEQGLIHLSPHRGARVASLDARDAYEVYTLMAAAEGLALRLVKRRVSARVIDELKSALQTMRRAATRGDNSELARADLEFTDAVFRHANHHRLRRVWQNLKFQSYLLVREYVKRVYSSLSSLVDHQQRLVTLLESASLEELISYLQQNDERVERALRPPSEVSMDGR